jgi:hypothetical protein
MSEHLRTVELVPHGLRATTPVCIYGDPDFEINLAEQDLFCRSIDLRTRMKKSMKSMKPGPDRDRLDDDQNGVKEMANATSYGIPVEVVAEEQNERSSMDVYFGEDYAKVQSNATKFNDNGEWVLSGFKTEYPGKFFGPWGPLIPAGGRLLLSMVEKLASDVRITYSHCDTDSMSFVRPAHMGREEFHDYVKYIADKLQSLNPFETNAPIFGNRGYQLQVGRRRNRQGQQEDRRAALFLGHLAEAICCCEPGQRKMGYSEGNGTWRPECLHAGGL